VLYVLSIVNHRSMSLPHSNIISAAGPKGDDATAAAAITTPPVTTTSPAAVTTPPAVTHTSLAEEGVPGTTGARSIIRSETEKH
jgi:hypothetical protein